MHHVSKLAGHARTLRRLAANPSEEIKTVGDLLMTRREMRFLREIETPRSTPFALLILLDEALYETKLMMMLGVGLRLSGTEVKVLVRNHRSIRVKQFARAFGISQFISFEDVDLTSSEEDGINRAAIQFSESELNLSSVKQWQYHGSSVGYQVLATLSRKLRSGIADLPTLPNARTMVQALTAQALADYHRAKIVLERHRPKACILVEANYSPYGALTDASVDLEIDVLQVTQPWQDDALIFKRLTRASRRHHPSSLSAETWASIRSRRLTPEMDTALDDVLHRRYSKVWLLQQRNQPPASSRDLSAWPPDARPIPAKKVAVVFSHILWDANLFYGEDLFEDYGDWLLNTLRAAISNDKITWILKLHPANLWKRQLEGHSEEYAELRLIRKHIGDLPNHIVVLRPEDDVSTWTIFTIADIGITVRGTAGMEMACFGKPVLTAGTGRYAGLGFTLDSSTREEYLERLGQVHDLEPLDPEKTELARKHAWAVFCKRPWIMRSFRPSFKMPEGRRFVVQNLRVNAYSIDEVVANGDLAAWARWAIHEPDLDYLS